MAENSGLYQLHITLSDTETLEIGRLGSCSFPKGKYIYTGSAKRGLNARIERHKRNDKKLHWHIDYFLATETAKITSVEIFKFHEDGECVLNQSIEGKHVVNGFGASDCRNGCKSHFVFVGK
ncbi:MAG: GIY-YIG nuclease family protein [Bacteroidetes bacterium]|nr:GIY-YIG nuclease family protein [Bacteroidota bacterium]